MSLWLDRRFDYIGFNPVNTPFSFSAVLAVSFLLPPETSGEWRRGQQNALTRYVAAADVSFEWKVSESDKRKTVIDLTSQTWRNIVWKQQVTVIRPAQLTHPDLALLFITGSGSSERYLKMLQGLADQAGAVVSVINNVPNQPLFGRKEDALIAHTFAQYIESGEDSWPLLFPMVKSVVRGMDTVAAFTKREGHPVKNFLLTGASKRGWTTWLTGAIDRRVVAIAPMVFDILNSKVQTDWAREIWGEQSEQISDYTEKGLIREVESPGMKQIREWVDPYEYRRMYTMPKLLLLGLNDPYWVVDSARHYWRDLGEPKLMYQMPNAGHKLNEPETVRTLGAFFEITATGKTYPSMRWQVKELANKRHEVQLNVSTRPSALHFWEAKSTGRDFRKAKWRRHDLESGAELTAQLIREEPEQGYEAVVLEATFGSPSGKEFRLSTEPFVFPLLRGGKTDVTNARRPTGDAELKYWLQNLVSDHGFGATDVQRATGLNASEQSTALERFNIEGPHAKPTGQNALKIRPFPGGWHPRVGFLDGAVDPQRETKVSVFTPWDSRSFVVVDVPEAIWSNLGLTYLAHTHVPTIWSDAGSALPVLEWDHLGNDSYSMQRTLPNGIEFGGRVQPAGRDVKMELWLKNGTSKKLTGMRVQNCVMLKGAPEFSKQSNDNKVIQPPFIACRNDTGDRWVITAWEPNHRSWGNVLCPCLHSDPIFPDAEPGQTTKVNGWLAFYEGSDIGAELKRLRQKWKLADAEPKRRQTR
jgi:PhoPQ-activated pathogenicity-related protein